MVGKYAGLNPVPHRDIPPINNGSETLLENPIPSTPGNVWDWLRANAGKYKDLEPPVGWDIPKVKLENLADFQADSGLITYRHYLRH